MDVITRVAGSSPLFKTTSQYPTLSSCANLHVVSAHTIVSCSLVAELGITTSAVAGPNLSAPVPLGVPRENGT